MDAEERGNSVGRVACTYLSDGSRTAFLDRVYGLDRALEAMIVWPTLVADINDQASRSSISWARGEPCLDAGDPENRCLLVLEEWSKLRYLDFAGSSLQCKSTVC
jgi:hypothetical protein